VDQALRAVADPTRRQILRLVRDDEMAAGEIAHHFPAISRPAVSQHLRVLAEAGLVDVHAEGNRRLYRLRPAGLRDAARFLDDMWSDTLPRLKAAAERVEWPERTRAAPRARRARRSGNDA
jgi:DNA-binding transcriptional ArsR family regulator